MTISLIILLELVLPLAVQSQEGASEIHDKFELLVEEYSKYSRGSIDSLRKYGDKLYELAYGSNDNDAMMRVRAEVIAGYIQERLGNLDSSRYHYLEALGMARNNNFREREKAVLNYLGLLNYQHSQYNEALTYQLQSLKLREADGNKEQIANSYNNIGLVYYRIRDFEKAIASFERAAKIKRALGLNLPRILLNLGLCYAGLKDHQRAMKNYRLAIEFCQRNCQGIYAEAYNGMGMSLFEQQRYTEAYSNFSKSINVSKSNQLMQNLVLGYYYLSKTKRMRGMIEGALLLSRKSLDLAISHNMTQWIGYNYEQLALIHSKLGDYELAYELQVKYDSINSELLNKGVIKDMANIQADYEQYENQKIIARQDQALTARTTYLIIFLILFVFVTLIVIILYRSNRFRKRANRQIYDTLEELRTTQNKLIYQEKQAAMNRVTASLAHQLNSPLGAVKALLEPLQDSFMTLIGSFSRPNGPGTLDSTIVAPGDDAKIMEPLVVHQHQQRFQSHIQHVRDMTERMAYLVKTMQVQASPKSMLLSSKRVDLGENIQETIDTFTLPANIRLVIDIPSEPVYVQGDKVALFMTWQNIVKNAVEAMGDKGCLTVTLQAGDGFAQASFVDDGIGIAPSAEKDLFEPFYTTKEKSYHTGLGLTICRTVIENHGGAITYMSENGSTIFKTKLPL